MCHAAIRRLPSAIRTARRWSLGRGRSTVSAGQRERAQIVLAIADGAGVSGTARALGVSRPTVIKWRDRFAARRG